MALIKQPGVTTPNIADAADPGIKNGLPVASIMEDEMSLKRILMITLLLILLPFTLKLHGCDFAQADSPSSDIKIHKVDDTVTVDIYENSPAIDTADTGIEKTD